MLALAKRPLTVTYLRQPVRWRLERASLRRQMRLSVRRFCTAMVTRADSVSAHWMRVPIETEMKPCRGGRRGSAWR